MSIFDSKAIGAWVGLAKCGCCRAVASVFDDPKENKWIEKSKREFLRSGLSVLYVTWQQYVDTYSKTMQHPCALHDTTPTSQARLDLLMAPAKTTASSEALVNPMDGGRG